MLTRLHQHLDADAFRDLIFLDQPAHEVEIELAGGGETDFDLLEADLDQQLPHQLLLLDRHRLEQRLIAITQVDTRP